MVSFDIEGVIAPVFTPTDDNGNLKLSIVPQYMEFLVNRDCRDIMVGGTTGEFVTMSLNERKQVLDAWLAAVKPYNGKIIANIGGVPLPDVLEMARYCEEKHVDAILTMPEFYYRPKTTDQLVSYLETVSSAAPSLPLLYYHSPLRSGVNVNIPEFFTKATSRIPNFKGIKAELSVALLVTDLLQGDQRVFIMTDVIAPAVLMGHESSMATITTIFPLLVQDVVDATKDGDVKRVREDQGKLNRIVNAILAQGEPIPAMKTAMSMVTGIRMGPPRKPLDALDYQQITLMAENLANLGIAVQRDAVYRV